MKTAIFQIFVKLITFTCKKYNLTKITNMTINEMTNMTINEMTNMTINVTIK